MLDLSPSADLSLGTGHDPIRRGDTVFKHTENWGVQARSKAGPLWSDDFTADPPASNAGEHPRQIKTTLTKTLWSDAAASTVAGACADGIGMRVAGWCVKSGTRLWTRRFDLPPPAFTTDPNPPPGNIAEELHGFLSTDQEALVVCIQRTTRCEITIEGGPDNEPDWDRLKLPKFQSRLEVSRLDPLTGKTLWESHHDNVHVGIVERAAFDGLFAAKPEFGIFDWSTGARRLLLKAAPRAKLAWPKRRGDEAICAHHAAGQLHINAIPIAGGPPRVSYTFEVPRLRRDLELYLAGDVGIVNVDSQTYVPLDRNLKPTALIKTGGWFRGVVARENGLLELCTTLGTTWIHPDTGRVTNTSRF